MHTADPEVDALAVADRSASDFVLVPATRLPCGTEVPAFAVSRYLAARGRRGQPAFSASAAPWVNISYHMARRVCTQSGLFLLTELQALAIAHDVAGQAINWSGGAVGAGKLYQGLHKAIFRAAQPPCVKSLDPDERRWHQLSTGERIYDFVGNAFSWVFDDVQGNGDGVVARTFAPDSPTITTAPGAPLQQGLGWWPAAGRNWWGRALARGGSFSSQDGAGGFALIDERPRSERNYIGFRCTLPPG
jgi:hypothetical protein